MEKTKLLILRITEQCNLACKYCYASGKTEKTEVMSLQTAMQAVDLLAKPGERLNVQFTGGEPLLYPELLWDIFQYIKAQGIRGMFSVQTNGTLLTRENCELLGKMRCGVGVSLDGMGEANGLRCYADGRPAFTETVNGIRNLAVQGIQCNLTTVVSSRNQEKLEEILELAAYLQNVRGIGLDMFRPIGRGEYQDFTPDLRKLPSDLHRLLKKQKELSSLGVNIKLKEQEKVRRMLQSDVEESCYCYAQTGYSFAVDPVGDIYPCSSFVGMADMKLGNVSDAKHLKEITVPGMGSACAGCVHAAVCRGGCPAGKKACGGHSHADCLMHKTIIEYVKSEEMRNETVVSD